MNALSWLIYLASVASSVGLIAAIALIVSVVIFLAGLIVVANNPGDDYQTVLDSRNEERVIGAKMIKNSIRVFIICTVLMVVLPGRETMYAIVASEMGEEVLNSETGSKAVKALDAWLDRQIAPEPET